MELGLAQKREGAEWGPLGGERHRRTLLGHPHFAKNLGIPKERRSGTGER